MPHRRLITKILQRYWRASRGLRLTVRACVRDAQGNWLLVRDSATAPWRLPGGPVARGESAPAALARWLAAVGVEMTAGPRLIAMLQSEAAAKADSLDTCHRAIFAVPSWRLAEAGQSADAAAAPGRLERSFFAPGRLPHGLDASTIADIAAAS